MTRRYVAIWFRHLSTDWHIRRQPALRDTPFVLAAPERGRMMIKAASSAAEISGISTGMVVADGRAILPQLQVLHEEPGQAGKLLNALAEWCLRYTPAAAPDISGGLLLDITGCAHLWGGERPYLKHLLTKLIAFGYDVRAAIADTIGAAWAVSRFGRITPIIANEKQAEAIALLPASALRLEPDTVARLEKLGLYQIGSFMQMPRAALRRRFGASLLLRLDQALGHEPEVLVPVQPLHAYQERLPCLEPIRTATGIEIALKRLLEALCSRFEHEEKGLRTGILKGYRVDGEVRQIDIGTSRPSRNTEHLFRLFNLKICQLEPDLGFELFVLEAPIVEDLSPVQEMLWNTAGTGDETAVAELLDRLAGKIGVNAIHRYLPDEHYWPERSIKLAASLNEAPQTAWRTDRPRPVHLLPRPEPITVTVPLPDYPPMLFRYREKLVRVSKADGPERIEQEWWLEEGQHRDYYSVEDEDGARYWLFRLGSYSEGEPQWFMHGFFA